MPGSTTTPGHMDTRAVVPIRVAFRQQNDVGAREEGLFRGRDEDFSSPPAQIRASATNALGSYLEYVTRNRWSGHGCSTCGDGRKRAISRHIRSHVSRCR
jgi:hypothetical protein